MKIASHSEWIWLQIQYDGSVISHCPSFASFARKLQSKDEKLWKVHLIWLNHEVCDHVKWWMNKMNLITVTTSHLHNGIISMMSNTDAEGTPNAFVLSGYAGSAKTFLITHFLMWKFICAWRAKIRKWRQWRCEKWIRCKQAQNREEKKEILL